MNFLMGSSLVWSPIEIMKLKSISDVQVAPDNQTVAYVVGESDLTNNVYVKNIYKNGALFKSQASQPRWSPNGQWLAFVSEKKLWVMPSEGGSPREITRSAVETFRWSPDSSQIAFVQKSEKAITGSKNYREDTAVNQLWLTDLSDAKPRLLTGKEYCIRGGGDFGSKTEEFDWSPNGKTIVFSYAPTSGLDDYHLEGSLASIDVATGRVTPWEKKNSYEAAPRFSRDGKWVAYITSEGQATFMYDRYVAIRSVDGGNYRRLAASFNEGPFLAGPSLLGWNQEGSHLLFFEPKGTRYHIAMLPVDGGEAFHIGGDEYFDNPSLSLDGSTLGLARQSSSKPPEAFIVDLKTFKQKQVSQINRVPGGLPKTEVIRWKGADGWEIEGLLTYPASYNPKQKYPLLLVIHGGPMGFFRDSYLGTPYVYPYLSFAEAGFMVLRPNPRGSTGYGKEFRSANVKDWGGKDYVDLMRGVDALIEQGIVDEERMGVMGWSYGGYMTAWTITQTSRFKLASLGAGPVNLISGAGTTDVPRLFSDYLGQFWENSDLYVNRSPLSLVSQIQTPCLIQHGVSDLRVPISQSYEFQHALEKQGKESTFLIYSHTSHGFEKPLDELDSMQKNLEWFQPLLK